MDIADIAVAVLAVIGGLQVVLKGLIKIIPGDRDDKVLGPVIGLLETLGGVLSVKPKNP